MFLLTIKSVLEAGGDKWNDFIVNVVRLNTKDCTCYIDENGKHISCYISFARSAWTQREQLKPGLGKLVRLCLWHLFKAHPCAHTLSLLLLNSHTPD